MRRIAASLAVALVLAACGKSDPPAPSASAGASTGAGLAGVAADVAQAKKDAGTVNGRCPVQVDLLVVADADTVDFQDPVSGKTLKVGFCCDKCPVKFREDPEKYVARMRADPVRFGYAP